MKVAFCRLDARDDYYTGYSPVAFYDNLADRPLEERSQEIETLEIFMRREYLTKLSALQSEIATKYETLAQKISTHTPAVPDARRYGHALSKQTYLTVERTAKDEFPGEEAEYYT